MNLPESPHQAAISGGAFKVKVRPVLDPQAAELVRVYEAVPGALTYPGCCPEGLAAVLDCLKDEAAKAGDDSAARNLGKRAARLRGETP